MRWKKNLGAVAAICLIGLAAHTASKLAETRLPIVSQLAGGSDPIVESFERELNHEPGPAARTRRESIGQDELYRATNQVSWTRDAETSTATSSQPDSPRSNRNEITDY